MRHAYTRPRSRTKTKMPISTRPNAAVPLELGGPREDEHRFHVEHHEEQGEDVVADLALRPAVAHRVDAALVGDAASAAWACSGRTQAADPEQQAGQQQGDRPEPDHGEVVAKKVGHRGATLLRRVNRLTNSPVAASRSDESRSPAAHGRPTPHMGCPGRRGHRRSTEDVRGRGTPRPAGRSGRWQRLGGVEPAGDAGRDLFARMFAPPAP